MKKTSLLILLFSIAFFSCKKNVSSSKENTKEEEVNVGTLRYAGPGTPNKKIQSDPNFLALVNIDNEILKGLDSNKIWLDSAEFESAVNDIENASNSDELIHGLTEFGDPAPDSLFEKMRKKIDITYDLVTTSPELQGLTKDSIKAVLSATYSDYLLTHHRSFRTQYDCVKDYVDGMSDCDEDFAITTLGTLVGAIGATIFGTPVAGAAAVSTGIGIAYAQHTRCASSVARDYRKCRGYQ